MSVPFFVNNKTSKMNKIEKFKTFIRFIVSIFASREFAFVYCIVGTLAQIAHTYYLIESISSLQGWGKIFQAVGLSVFISSSLLFFTAIADNDKSSKDYKRIHLAVNLFMVIEIIINFYYYAAHLIIQPRMSGGDSNIFDFIFAILVSCLIPVTIKLYAGIIQAKEWFESFQKNSKNIDSNINESNIELLVGNELSKRSETEQKWVTDYVTNELTKFKSTFIESFGEQVNSEFEKQAEKFLEKFKQQIQGIKQIKQTKQEQKVETKIESTPQVIEPQIVVVEKSEVDDKPKTKEYINGLEEELENFK